MTVGEQLYLALVLLSFCTFGVTLAVVSARTSRYVRRKGTKEVAGRDQSSLKNAA